MNIRIEALFSRSGIFAIFVLVVLVASVIGMASELNAGETLLEMLDDVIMVVFSVGLLSLFCVDYFRQQRSLKDLKSQLESVRGKLDSS